MQNDNKRPWQQQSRSWIFFMDEIAKEKNIISESMDENVFMLDCEVARLSIWSKKWNTFVDVGVSSFLKEENTARRTGKTTSAAEIRVFYKGIELEKINIQKDAGIIEFIDIKRDLEREYINISRGSFTAKGREFFEEQLYPGLLDAIRKVLKHLAASVRRKGSEQEKQQDKEQVEEIFSQKIERIVKEKCDRMLNLRGNSSDEKIKKELAKLRDEIISISVGVSVLSYFSARDEWNIEETMTEREEQEENEWLNLVAEIDRTLSESDDEFIVSELASATKFFDIKVYNEEKEIAVNKVKDAKLRLKFRFTQIFAQDKHWAILQIRKDAFSTWTSYLVLLGNEETGKSDEYEKMITFPRSAEDCRNLEEWGTALCNGMELSDDEADSSQQFLMNWLLKNVPTVGLFCDRQGNVRINILARRIYPSIFLNTNFKYLILNRIMEKAESDGIQRFSTLAWQGQEMIGCHQLPFKIFFVKRGFLSACSLHKIIIPFEGNLLKKWKEIITKPSEIEKSVEKLVDLADIHYETLLKDMNEDDKEKLKNMEEELQIKNPKRDEKDRDSTWSRSAPIAQLVYLTIADVNFNPTDDFEQLLKSTENIQKWQELRFKLAKFCIFFKMNKDENEKGKLINEIREDETFQCLCNAWFFLMFEQEQIFDVLNKVKEEYLKCIGMDASYDRKKEKIAEYLVNEISYKYSRRKMIQYIESYEKELLELFHHMECERIRKHIDILFANNMFLFSQLYRLKEVQMKKGEVIQS